LFDHQHHLLNLNFINKKVIDLLLMDFKERFKGRTSNITKEGIITNLAAPSSNYVMKSTSNALLNMTNSTSHDQPSQCNSFYSSFPLNSL